MEEPSRLLDDPSDVLLGAWKGGLRVADLLADLAIRGAVGLDRNPQPQILPETDHPRRSPDYLGDLAVEIMRIAIPMRPQKTNHRGL